MMDHVIFFRYLDRWEKRDCRWAIVQRRACIDLENSALVAAPWMVASGRRDRSDISYDMRIGNLPGTARRES